MIKLKCGSAELRVYDFDPDNEIRIELEHFGVESMYIDDNDCKKLITYLQNRIKNKHQYDKRVQRKNKGNSNRSSKTKTRK